MKKSLLSICFVVFLLNVAAQVNKTWSGASGANWNVATNWTPNGVPGPTDTAVFSSNNQCNVDINTTIAAIRALGVGNANQLGNNTGVAKTITVSSNPASSPVLYVQAGSNFTLGAFLSTAGVSIQTYGAAGTTNIATVDGAMNFGYTSAWTVANGTAVTNVSVTVSGMITLPGVHTAANLFIGSTTANVHFQAGASLQWSRNGGAIPIADYQDGSTINVTGVTGIMPTFSTANYNGILVWNCSGQTISGAAAILLPTASSAMDSIKVMNTGSGTLRVTTEPAYTLGNVQVTGGTLEMSAPIVGNSTATINGNLEISGGTVIGNATYTGDVAAAFGTTLTVNGKLIMSNGTFTLTNRPIVGGSGGGCKFNIKGDVIKTGGTVNAINWFTPFLNEFALTGTTAQNVTLNTFSGPIRFNVNNSSAAGVTLLSSLTIPALPAALDLSLGVLNTSTSNLLIMSAGSLVGGGDNTSFVDGPVKKIGNTGFIFPVGKKTCGPSGNVYGYMPISISNFMGTVTTSDEFTAEYKREDALTLGAISNVGIKHVSRCDYWTLVRGATTASTVDIYLFWDETLNNCVTTSPYINDLPTLTIAHNSNPGTWDNLAPTGNVSGSGAAGNIAWMGTQPTTYGAFALASTSFSTNPLPISLNYLNGIKQNGAHYLNWKVTCSDNNSATMVLERSADGRNFTSLTSITADALRCQQPFDHTDNAPLAGMNYYRLKMIDANGKITYSNIIALLNKESGFEIVNLSPNLVTNDAILNVTAAQKTKMDVVITDISGRQVQKITYNLIAGSNQFNLNLSALSAGTYQIKGYAMNAVSRTIRFVKQ